MATERIVNVPINFKINTVEVEKYDNLLKRADQSAEKLGQTSNRAAAQSAASFRSTGSSITAMRTDLERLKVQIESTSKADTTRLAQLSAQYKSLNAEIQKQTKLYLDQSKAVKQTAASTKDLVGQFGELYSAVKLVVSAGMVGELVNISLNMAKLSGNIEGVSRAFNRLPGAVLIMAELRKATHDTITEFNLMQTALRAQNMGISLRALPALLEFAAVRAQQTGVSMDYLVNSIVDGIGRKSLRVLDNLQIAQSRIKEQLGGISIEAATVAQVSEAMGRIAVQELNKMGGFAETTATKVEKLESKWEKLRGTVSKALTSPAVLAFYDKVLTYFEAGVQTATQGGNTVVQSQARDQALLNVESFKQMHITEEILTNRQKAFDVVQQEINTSVQLIARNNDILKQMKDRHTQLTTDDKFNSYAEDRELDAIIEQTKFYSFKNLVLKDSIEILKSYLQTLEVVNQQELQNLGIIESKKQEIKDLNEDLEKATSTTQVINIRFKIDKAQGELNELMEGSLVTNKQTGAKELRTLSKNVFKAPKSGEFNDFTEQALQELQKSIDNILLHKPLMIAVAPEVVPMDFMDRLEQAIEDNKEAIRETSYNIANEQIQSLLFAEVEAYEARIQAARNFYDEQISLAGDNERAKSELRIKESREIEELRKKAADREKKASLAGILVNTAIGIMKAFATSATFYDGLVKSAIVAAEGASQYAIANRARYYAKGALNIDGPGTKTSDSIPAFLSKGESVLTADETNSSMNILKSIRAKKLNDKVLKDLMSGRSGGSAGAVFDDRKILQKLDEVKNATPDLVKRANMIYEVRKKGDSYMQTIRSKSMGK
jgi:hypothetical protein